MVGSTHYQQPCGCEITVVLDCNGYEHVEITYCSRHAAAPALYEVVAFYMSMENTPANELKLLRKAEAALVLADKARVWTP